MSSIESSIILQPCIISGNHVVEFNLARRINIGSLPYILKDQRISDLKYCEELGIAKFYLEDKRVRLDKTGLINIGNIKDLEEAEVYIKIIEETIQKALY